MTKANEENVEWMRQDNTPTFVEEDTLLEIDLIWQALADCPITLTMSKFLNLVSRFRQAMDSRLQIPQTPILANFTEPSGRPAIIDHPNPTIKEWCKALKSRGALWMVAQR